MVGWPPSAGHGAAAGGGSSLAEELAWLDVYEEVPPVGVPAPAFNLNTEWTKSLDIYSLRTNTRR